MKYGKTEKPKTRRHRPLYAKEPIQKAPVLSLRQVLRGAFVSAAALTLIVTVYALKLPAITASYSDCELEEHTHTVECYDRELICDNTDEDHEHSDECFGEKAILVCDKEQHTHTEECCASKDAAPVGDGSDSSDTGSGYDLNGCTDLEEYLSGVNGYIESDLYDSNGNLIDNIFEASGTGYSYEFSIVADYILAGEYYCAMPKNMTPDDDVLTGNIYYLGEIIGSFRMEPGAPYLFFTFGDEINSYQNITGELSFGCSFTPRMKPAISKYGYLISPENVFDGYFHFSIRAKIPAAGEGVPKREWKLLDRSVTTVITEQVADTKEWYHDFGSEINAPNTQIYLSYGDVSRYELRPLQEVYDDDSVSLAYFADSDSKLLYLVNRCTCDDARCVHTQAGSCSCDLLAGYDGWCSCWCFEEDATLDIVYKNAINGADGSLILQDQEELAKAESSVYTNTVTLKGTYTKNGVSYQESKMASMNIDYSAVVDKSEAVQARSSNGLKSTFSVVLNPQKADFSKLDVDGDGHYDNEVVLHDAMTNQKYVTGSMTITAEDQNDDTFELTPNTDFSVDAVQTDTGTKLTIVIKALGPWKYTILYKGQAYADEDGTLKISNDVSVSLFGGNDGGDNDTDDNPEYDYSRTFSYKDRWVFKKYEVRLIKVDAHDPAQRLEDAVYGLYSEDGTEIIRRGTGADGTARYATDIANGVIFENDTPYYLKEISPPDDYDVNTVRHWFYFSEARNTALEDRLAADYPGAVVTYIAPDGNTGYHIEITATDERVFTLPATGASGTGMFFIFGALMIAAAAGLIFLRRRQK